MKWLQYFIPGFLYWRGFLKRFTNIPPEYQLEILDEYEEAGKQGRRLDVKKMWVILKEGESRTGKKVVKMCSS